jgi:O-glycosyl hydrolase
MYALSPQNEPDFSEPYGSCQYTGADLIQVMDTIGRKIRAAGLHTKIFLPEDVYGNWSHYNQYIVADTAAYKYITAIAYHGYRANGVTPAQMDPATSGQAYTFAHAYGWQTWSSENELTDAMPFALNLIGCLRYGKVSLYMGDILDGDQRYSNPAQCYMSGATKNLYYYVAKCFNKFIRPGSVQLRTTSPDSATFAGFVAFYDSSASALIISAATNTTNSQDISIHGSSLPANFRKWMTNPSTFCVDQGTVASGATITIPANSVVTLYGTGYTPMVSVRARDHASLRSMHQTTAEQLYDICGRKISSANLSSRNHLTLIVKNGQAQVKLIGVP